MSRSLPDRLPGRLSPLGCLGLVAGAALCAAGCLAEPAFSPHLRDNNVDDMRRVLARSGGAPGAASDAATGAPGGSGGSSLAMHAQRRASIAYLVTAADGGAGRHLVAWDLAQARAVWDRAVEVTSRVVAAGGVVLYRRGRETLEARDARSGALLYAVPLGQGKLLGIAAASGRAYWVMQSEQGGRRTGEVRACALHTGGGLWSRQGVGSMGAPAARGRVVAVPYLHQYVVFLDGESGNELGRIRITETDITFVRADAEGIFYGGRGVFLASLRSTTGTAAGSSFVAAKLPADFHRLITFFDGYGPVQANYSAYDRNRLLWRAERVGDDGVAFAGGTVVAHSYRFLFGVDARAGGVRWAYAHPDVDLVSSEHTGQLVLFADANGRLGGVQAASGAVVLDQDTGRRLAGVTFDADGLEATATASASGLSGPGSGSPAGAGAGGAGSAAGGPAARSLLETLHAIVWDPDRRFAIAKLAALDALATLPGKLAAEELLRVLRQPDASLQLYGRAAQALARRQDSESIPVLVDALSLRNDYVAGTTSRAVEVLARTLAARGVTKAAPPLALHLLDPSTPVPVLRELADALGRLGGTEAAEGLGRFMVLYHCDPLFASDPGPLLAVSDAILRVGGMAGRRLLLYAASDQRTLQRLREHLLRGLKGTAAQVTADQAPGSGEHSPESPPKQPPVTPLPTPGNDLQARPTR